MIIIISGIIHVVVNPIIKNNLNHTKGVLVLVFNIQSKLSISIQGELGIIVFLITSILEIIFTR